MVNLTINLKPSVNQRRVLLGIGLAFIVLVAVAALWLSLICYQFFYRPLHLSPAASLLGTTMSAPASGAATGIIFTVKPGAGIGQIAYQLAEVKLIPSKTLFRWFAHALGAARKIQAGEYYITPSMTQYELLQHMRLGTVVRYGFTIVPGWNLQQLFTALRLDTKLLNTSAVLTSQANNSNYQQKKCSQIEGLFWPDTYYYQAGTTDLDILQRANEQLQTKLTQMWQQRAANCLLNNMDEAVILASIIEKETSLAHEYFEISGVYQRRLAKNMPLQADPTVIYGLMLHDKFKFPLTKQQLKFDSPYNTYKHRGLPPTPIAIPSESALYAALHPNDGDTLYFVAKGDGSHIFSTTIAEHKVAVELLRRNKTTSINSEKL